MSGAAPIRQGRRPELLLPRQTKLVKFQGGSFPVSASAHRVYSARWDLLGLDGRRVGFVVRVVHLCAN